MEAQTRAFFKTLLTFLLILLGLGVPLFWMLGPVDDAYITCRFADNLAQGKGIVFNPGENVEGCTNFGLMVLLAAAGKIGAPNLVRVAQGLGILAWALVCTLAFGLIRRRQTGPISFSRAFAAAFLVGCLSPLAWAYSGMETALVAALWLGAVVLHFREEQTDRLPILSALATVGAGLMRPDGILIAVVIGLSILWPLNRKRFGKALAYSAVVLLLFCGYWLWRWNHFGYLLPNTFYAKVGSGGGRLFVTGAFYVGKGMLALVMPILALGFSFRLVTQFRSIPRRTWVFAGVCGLNTAYLFYIGGDFFPMNRFFMPMLAFWALLFADLTELGSKNTDPADPKKAPPTSLQNWIKAAACVILVNVPCAMVHGQLAKHVYLVGLTEEWSEVGRKFEQTLPADAKMAVIPIGALGYWSDRYILDMLGLIDLHIAHKKMQTGRGVIGHEKFDNEYILSKHPELILTWPMFVRPVLSDLLDWRLNHMLSPAQRDMLMLLRDNGDYAPMAIPMDNDRYVPALVRNDLLNVEPYSGWTVIEGKARAVMFSNDQEVRWIIGKVGRKAVKGDLLRAMSRVRNLASPEERIF